MRLVIFGPPGAGKGTQAKKLEENHALEHLSTGDLFRAAMEADSPLGDKVRSYVNAGNLVPDELVWKMVKNQLEAQDVDEFVLDGYPRTVPQARLLDDFLQSRKKPLDAVISLEVPEEIIVDRLSKRRLDPETGNIYHLEFNPPPAGIPDERLVHREDDQPEAIRHRISVYDKETAPVRTFYRERGLLCPVNGRGSISEVQRQIEDILASVSSKT